jgi:ubiquinone/menaquinone biosynthesis C-methylase UbiE
MLKNKPVEDSVHVKKNEAKWNKWAGSMDGKGWRYEYLRQAQKNTIDLVGLKPNMNFLDIGCGTGWAIGQAAELVNSQGNFYGVDLSEKMIEKATENFKGKENFHFIKANAEAIPLQEGWFDMIICTHSFHHYLHPLKALNEMKRLLKTGGRAFILDVAADTFVVRLADKISGLLDKTHVRFYRTREYEKLFTAAGLKYAGCAIINKYQKVQIAEK